MYNLEDFYNNLWQGSRGKNCENKSHYSKMVLLHNKILYIGDGAGFLSQLMINQDNNVWDFV